MTKRRRAPKSPEAIAMEAAARRRAERNPETWGPNVHALQRQPDVTIRKGRGRDVFAERKDVFARLFDSKGLSQPQLDSVRRLEADIAERKGEDGKGQRLETVDCGSKRQAVTQRMIDAGKRVDTVLALTGVGPSKLLRELIDPSMLYTQHSRAGWRVIVALVTGERNEAAQGGAVRQAAESLRLAYAAVDAGERRAG